MRIFFLLCLLTFGWGCQVAPGTSPVANLEATSHQRLDSARIAELDAQREAFLAAPDLAERLRRLLELEQQALQLAVDEPLKLGSIGSAILDVFPSSQTGHYVMSRFYAHVESLDAKATHDAALAQIQAYMRSGAASGTAAAPYKIMTTYDAHAYARSQGKQPVGSMYRVTDMSSMHLLLVSKPESAGLQSSHFDLSHLVRAVESNNASDPHAWRLLQVLAARMDSAAQTTIGRMMMGSQRYDDAVSWFKVAARSGNVLANISLARLYLRQADGKDNEEDQQEHQELLDLVMENYLHAIAMGSTEAMYTLANLYINDYYGEENRSAAVPLLRQAGELGHPESLLYMGYLHNTGREVPQDPAKAAQYFARAAALNNTQAILSYGRFLSAQRDDVSKETGAIHEWLEGLADDAEAEAMVILGNLHARGIATPASNRDAVRWYKKAVKAAPEDAEIINEVAWTLTVSDVEGLQRTNFARRIMDTLMETSEDARQRPEYLDTWAATYAASGDFERAISLQERAIEVATEQQREDVLEILQGHLELFKAGATITEQAP